jgi:hypothetical protein
MVVARSVAALRAHISEPSVDFDMFHEIGHDQTVKTFPAGLVMPAQVGEAICTHSDAPGESRKPRSLVRGDAVDETSPCPGKAADMESNSKRIFKYMCMLTVCGNAIFNSCDLVSTVFTND